VSFFTGDHDPSYYAIASGYAEGPTTFTAEGFAFATVFSNDSASDGLY